jgi:hypothetical protein
MEKEFAAELAVRNKLTARKADQNGLIETSVGMRRTHSSWLGIFWGILFRF